MFENLLHHIKETLSGIPELRYVDEDWGQLSISQSPVQYPCALVDLDGFTFTQAGMLSQQAVGEIYVLVADQRLGRSSARATTAQKETHNAFFALLEQINRALHGTAPQGCSPLCRTGLKKVAQEDGVRVFQLAFRTSFSVETPRPADSYTVTNLHIRS